MTMLWMVILAVALASAAIKAAGPVLVGGRHMPDRATAVVAMLAPAILSGLIVTQMLGGHGQLVLDERVLGLGVAAVALTLRAHLLVAVVLAALTVTTVRVVG